MDRRSMEWPDFTPLRFGFSGPEISEEFCSNQQNKGFYKTFQLAIIF